MTFPLNINLIIPFKDNKGTRRKMYVRDLEAFRDSLDSHALRIKTGIEEFMGSGFELAIAARSDGVTKKYFWRFRSGERDRKYNRLHAESVREYIGIFHYSQKVVLVEAEQELIYINANLRLVKNMLESIEQSVSETAELLEINLRPLG
jgi:hypothetical protein